MDTLEEISIIRGVRTGRKFIEQADFDTALEEIKTTVQRDDIEKLMDWKGENG
jgi:SpoVK/Ycf46/Vps4 family AAA+-type ATPase